MATIPSFKDMPLWQHSMRLAIDVLNIASQLPNDIKPTIGAELQRTVIDIPSLIASGTKAGKQGFQISLLRARQSAAELETLLLIVQQASPALPIDDTLLETHEIQAALTSTARRLSGKSPTATAAKII